MTSKEYKEVFDIYIDLESRVMSEKFLDKYWLSYTEMKDIWHPIKNKIFNSDAEDFPDLMFKKEFDLIALRGGCLFSKEDFYELQNCMKIAKDEYFVVIENELVRNTEDTYPHLRFKFPIDITWEELNNGNENFADISYELLIAPNINCFVFGDSGKWGKYVASDYGFTPLDIIGFKPELAHIFQEQFEQPPEEWEEIKEWLPLKYKEIFK